MPKISVIMSALNAEKYIRKAIESILNQTVNDIELIMVDDGSTDGTLKIMRQYERGNVHIIVNEKNLGIAISLNKAMQKASGKYIAKMDADDISALKRLEKQSLFMDAHPEVVVLGTSAYHIDAEGHVRSVHQQPLVDDALQFALNFHYPFYNSSLMLRRDMLVKHQIGHDEAYGSAAEDFSFVAKIASYGKLANLAEPLQFFRKHNESTCEVNADKQLNNNMLIAQKNLSNTLKNKYESEELKRLLLVGHSDDVSCKDFFAFSKMAQDAAGTNIKEEALKQVMGVMLLKTLMRNKKMLLDPAVLWQLIFNKKWGVFVTLRYKNAIKKWQNNTLTDIPD